MDVSMILDAADMSAPRLVPDFVAWVNGKVEEFGASPEVKALGRSGAQLPKKFYDELFPLPFSSSTNLPLCQRLWSLRT
jgi:hypothetical protein